MLSTKGIEEALMKFRFNSIMNVREFLPNDREFT